MINIPAEGTLGVWRGVDTRTSPSLSLQPSIAGGGTGIDNHPVNKVGSLEELMNKPLVGATQLLAVVLRMVLKALQELPRELFLSIPCNNHQFLALVAVHLLSQFKS
ncbi:uncharacterized protein LOC132599541 [Lycium barbarum]|uniref:uncharacterized protein LOC132599541 n=1 Tax=Lycium barbarum TaxID=112863 RepID=UPI00293F6006|nr:uncharacterized protein LOC132599541 [Lycium barbarum]